MKNTYINKTFELIDEYNNIIHRTIDSTLLIFKLIHISILMSILIHKSPYSVQEYHNTKIKKIFAEWYLPNWTEKIFVIKQAKEYHGCMLPKIIEMKKLFKPFINKSCRQQKNTKRKNEMKY